MILYRFSSDSQWVRHVLPPDLVFENESRLVMKQDSKDL